MARLCPGPAPPWSHLGAGPARAHLGTGPLGLRSTWPPGVLWARAAEQVLLQVAKAGILKPERNLGAIEMTSWQTSLATEIRYLKFVVAELAKGEEEGEASVVHPSSKVTVEVDVWGPVVVDVSPLCGEGEEGE